MKNSRLLTLHTLCARHVLQLITVFGLTAAITTLGQPSQPSPNGTGNRPMMMQGGTTQGGTMQTDGMMSGRMRGAMMSGGMMSSNMWAHCNGIMAMHRKMRAMMNKQDAELQQLVTQMKQAPKAKRTALMENIVTKMVNDQATMNEHMANMNARMMHLMRDQIRMDMMSGEGGQPAPSMMNHPGNMGNMGGMGGMR